MMVHSQFILREKWRIPGRNPYRRQTKFHRCFASDQTTSYLALGPCPN